MRAGRIKCIFGLLLYFVTFVAEGFTTTRSYIRNSGSVAQTAQLFLRRGSNADHSEIDFIKKSIENRSLVSVESCIGIYNYLQDENRKEEADSNVIFIDASWWHKGDLDGRKMFEDGPRIKGSFYFDLDDISSQYELYPTLNPKNLPHMIPPQELFAAFMDEYNISNDDHIVIYGRQSAIFSPRVWFTFKSFGHPQGKLHLMQGSFDDWIRKGGEIDNEKTVVPKAKDIQVKYTKQDKSPPVFNYKARNVARYIYSMEDVMKTTQSESDHIIIDSRGSSYVKGNIPDSYHIPYSKFQTEKSTVIKEVEELKSTFNELGIDPNTSKTVICSCGTGVSACTTFLALELCGRNVDTQPTFMYDGSWYEWGKEAGTPKETQ